MDSYISQFCFIWLVIIIICFVTFLQEDLEYYGVDFDGPRPESGSDLTVLPRVAPLTPQQVQSIPDRYTPSSTFGVDLYIQARQILMWVLRLVPYVSTVMAWKIAWAFIIIQREYDQAFFQDLPLFKYRRLLHNDRNKASVTRDNQ